MNSRKIGLIVVLALLVLGGSRLLPSSAQEDRENSLLLRVEVLEEQVAGLLARVETLEEGGAGDCCDTFDVIHLTPLDDFPSEPSEGDLCVVFIEDCAHNHLYCYMRDGWVRVDASR